MIVFLAGIYWLIAWINAPENYQSNLKLNFPSFAAIEELRAKFLFNLHGVSEDSAGLVAGLAIGERGMISDGLAENMKELSLTHLVAVSGANLAIIAAAVFLAAAAMGCTRFWRFSLAYLAIAAYIVLVGPESSVLRAGTMSAFVLAGWWLGRKVNPIVPLSWAVLLLVVVDPALSVDIGFALSVFATLGLLVLARTIFERLEPRLGTWLALGVGASVAAQLYTLPVLLILQPSIPIYSVLANLAVEVVIAPVTVLGILGVVSVSVAPQLTQLLSWVASLGTWWIETVSNHLSQLPGTRMPMVSGVIGISFTVVLVLGVTILLVSTKQSAKLIGLVCASSFVIPMGWVITDINRSAGFQGDWVIFNCDVGQGDALLLRDDGKVMLIDVGRDDKAIDKCLSSLGIEHIDLLVLTHFDADHVAGIRGALQGRSVELAMISGFKDDRPLVALVQDVLDDKSARTIIGHTGMTGTLGAAKWKVLSPSYAAEEAEDSNDASVVISVDFTNFNLLALGDLGEKGQDRLLRNAWPNLASLSEEPLVLKIAHHGSKDQSADLHRLIAADVAIFSVGQDNDYGHPSARSIGLATSYGAKVLRTDIQGAIAIRVEGSRLVASSGGKLST